MNSDEKDSSQDRKSLSEHDISVSDLNSSSNVPTNVSTSNGTLKPIHLSFSGCGFLCAYHVGVIACLREHGQHILSRVNRIYGASAGSLIGLLTLAGLSSRDLAEIIIVLSNLVSSSPLGCVDPDVDVLKIIRGFLNKTLPENIHEVCTGRLFVNLTHFPSCKPFLISTYSCKADVIDAVFCSSFIPLVFGFIPPTFRGKRYIDGGFTDNLPHQRVVYRRVKSVVDEMVLRSSRKYVQKLHGIKKLGEKVDTITVSPFSGEGDICPRDSQVQTLSRIELWKMSLGLTIDNLYRFLLGFVNPTKEGVVCRFIEGYNDTTRYLDTVKLVKSTDCLIKFGNLEMNVSKGNGPASVSQDGGPPGLTPSSSCGLDFGVLPSEIEPESCVLSSFCEDLNKILAVKSEELEAKYSQFYERRSWPSVQNLVLRVGFGTAKATTKALLFVFNKCLFATTPILHRVIRMSIPIAYKLPNSHRLVEFLNALSLACSELRIGSRS